MKLTVLIPVYNTPPAHLLEAVYSILNQDNKVKHDIILIDDCSNNRETLLTLATIENCKISHSAIYSKSDIKTLSLNKNSGTSVALNEGHKLVQTEYVAIMGSDDISDLSRFRKQTEYLKNNKEVDVLGTNLFAFYDNDIRRKSLFTTTHLENPDLTKNWFINHGTVIYKQSAWEKIGGYDGTKRRGQDVDMWMRMRTQGDFIFANIEECLYAWRRYKK